MKKNQIKNVPHKPAQSNFNTPQRQLGSSGSLAVSTNLTSTNSPNSTSTSTISSNKTSSYVTNSTVSPNKIPASATTSTISPNWTWTSAYSASTNVLNRTPETTSKKITTMIVASIQERFGNIRISESIKNSIEQEPIAQIPTIADINLLNGI
jgi:hypothetical protein